jgi:hypothetical protein
MSDITYNHKSFILLIYFHACNNQHLTFHFHSSFVGSGGLSFLQFCNLNSFRTKFVLGFSIFLGLSIPQYFNEYTAINGFGPVHTGARWVWLYNVSYSPASNFLSCAFYVPTNLLMYLAAVQWYSKCAIPIKSICCWSYSIFLG